ncbi:MAG: precorrin-2 C(20)-methyltransferase [Leptospirales bacterium]
MNKTIKPGRLYGIGAGPGDPELLTIKAYRVLQETPVIAYPQGKKGSDGYAYTIIKSLIDSDKKTLLPLSFPMTKDKTLLKTHWEKAVEEVAQFLLAGDDVAFVSEGDALFYSTFIHLMRVLRQKYPALETVVIPGVSSVYGAAASLVLPMSDGDEKFAVIPATDNMEQMKKQLQENDTVVFLKVAKVLQPMITLLEELELVKSAHVVSRATAPDEQIYRDVKELKGKEINYLSLMIVKTKEEENYE